MSRFIQPQKERKTKEPKPTPPPKPGRYTGEDLGKSRKLPGED